MQNHLLRKLPLDLNDNSLSKCDYLKYIQLIKQRQQTMSSDKLLQNELSTSVYALDRKVSTKFSKFDITLGKKKPDVHSMFKKKKL